MPVKIGWAERSDVERPDESAWHLRGLRIPLLWEQLLLGGRVRVAVLDSGVEDLTAFGKRLQHFAPDGSKLKSSPGVSSEHGTAFAALIAASETVRGVAPDATLVSIRISGALDRPLISKVRAALEEGIGARRPTWSRAASPSTRWMTPCATRCVERPVRRKKLVRV